MHSVAISSDKVLSDEFIIFASKENSTTNQIWIMNIDGSGKRQLTNDSNFQHEWSRPSPDGKKILYARAAKDSSVNVAAQSNELWVMNIDGSNKIPIIDIAKRNSYGWTGHGHAEWSPDSSKIVLVATLPNLTSEIFTVDINGNNPQLITKPVMIDGHKTIPLDPSWSKDNQIVFARSWSCFIICGSQDIFKIDLSTGKEVRITNDPQWNFDPYISPDGQHYLWLSFRESPVMCPCDLIRGNVTGDLEPKAVIADGGSNANGTFSSDSKRLLFLKGMGFKQVLHQINLDGSDLKSLAPSSSGESGIASFVPSSLNESVPETIPQPVTNPESEVPVTTSPPSTLPISPDTKAPTEDIADDANDKVIDETIEEPKIEPIPKESKPDPFKEIIKKLRSFVIELLKWLKSQ